MARLVRFERTGPIRIDPQDKPVFICGCGLTGNFPFCDGSHKSCRDESSEAVYVYDAEGRRLVRSDEESSLQRADDDDRADDGVAAPTD